MKRLALICLLATAVIAQDEPKRERPKMTEEQRAQTEQQLNDAWIKLSLENKMRVMHLHHALTQLPPEERKFIHDRVERFLNMSPEERQRIKENADHWKNMTPEQREEARQKFRERRRKFEEKWRKEHPGEEPPPFMHHHHDEDQNQKPEQNQQENK